MNDSGQVRDITRSKCPIRNTNIALNIEEDSLSSDNICIGMIDKGQKNTICKKIVDLDRGIMKSRAKLACYVWDKKRTLS